MKQLTGLNSIFSGIFSEEGIAIRLSFLRSSLFVLLALLATILLSAGQSIGDDSELAKAGKDADNPENGTGENIDPVPTPSATEGPYFKSGSPERKSLLEPGVVGDRVNLTGQVLTRSGKPISGALIDFWQADGNGLYDNVGYRLRGHQFTDDQGRYRLETVIPGNYGGRTKHIHVKVQAADGTALITQLFFPDEENNQRDSIFRSELLVSLNETEQGQEATFDFVLDMD
jgi:protocatechuate 3,4-dioxygenase beta subunit